MKKTHCDICDAVDAKDSHEAAVTVNGPHARRDLKVTIVVRNRYDRGAGEDDLNRIDVCAKCRDKALRRVLGMQEVEPEVFSG